MFETTYTVQRRPYAQRKRRVPDRWAALCAEAMVRHGYGSIAMAALLDPTISCVLRRCRVTPWHLLRRMHEADPKLSKCVRVHFKSEHSARVRAFRCKAAEQLLAAVEEARTQPQPYDFLQRMVFIDCKKLYIVPKSVRVYGHRGQRHPWQVLGDPRRRRDTKVQKLVFYVAVSAAGGVLLKRVTGTTEDLSVFRKVRGQVGWVGGSQVGAAGGYI